MYTRVWFLRVAMLGIVISIFQSAPSASAQMSKNLFGMRADSEVVTTWHTEPWPSVQFGSIRLWDSHTAWMDLNPSQGQYDWSYLDLWLAHAQAGGQNVLYTFGRTAPWASSNPHDQSCHYAVGVCDPPNDLNADGSGPNQHWKDFVTALVNHNQNSRTAHIQYWELWNEPFQPWEWNGTIPQMVRMVSDASAIIKNADPSAVILSPSFMWEDKAYLKWMDVYLASGGAKYADAISVHGYVYSHGGKDPVPENLIPYDQNFRAVLSNYGMAKMPIWDTEVGFGLPEKGMVDEDMQAAFVARLFLLHRSRWIRRLYWYSWNCPMGQLWAPDPKDRTLPGTLLKPGVAYEQISEWLVGTHMKGSCSIQGNSGSIWTCELYRPEDGFQGLVVWDASKTCSNGSCSTSNYQFSGNYNYYRTLDGDKIAISGNEVPIGAKPILLQNQ